MNATQVIVQGTLDANGKLELAEAPALPAGPVEVLIRTQPQAKGTGENWWEYLQRAHAELVSQGDSPRDREAIDADRSRERERDEARRQSLSSSQAP